METSSSYSQLKKKVSFSVFLGHYLFNGRRVRFPKRLLDTFLREPVPVSISHSLTGSLQICSLIKEILRLLMGWGK